MSSHDGFFDDRSKCKASTIGEGARAFERSRGSTTGELCWHCCHPFDWQGLPMPIAYDQRRDAFTVIGNFCGIGCMKAYNGTRLSNTKDINYTNITLFAKRCFGKSVSVPTAPPRSSLAAFGGTMTIEEFRSKSPNGETLVGSGPNVFVTDKDSFKVPAPPEDAERRVPTHGETREDFYKEPDVDEDCDKKAKKKPKASSAKKRPPPRTAPPPTDDAVLKLKKSKNDEQKPSKSVGMLASCMGIEISEIPPER